jgi:hypothetical protein
MTVAGSVKFLLHLAGLDLSLPLADICEDVEIP